MQEKIFGKRIIQPYKILWSGIKTFMDEQEEIKMRRNPLARTMTMFCFCFAVIFALVMGAMSYFVYEQDMMNRYHAYTTDVLNYVAREIDGDDLQECMRTGKKSAKYNELQNLTNDLKETHKLEFLYIIQPLSENPPDNMMDVLAAYTQAGKAAGTDGLTDLGKYTGDFYPPDVARNYIARMDKNPEVTFFPNDTEFGNIYTAIRPIFNSSGEPIAVLCADVLIDEITDGKIRFVKMSVAIAIIAGLFLVAISSHWLRKRIAEPILRIKNSATSFAERSHGVKDLDVLNFEDPQISTNDELEDLAEAISSMCIDMKSYTAQLILSYKRMNVLKEKVTKMHNMAHHDALTGAGNKAAYENTIKRMDWDILAGKAKFAIVMMDLNYLKKVNDTFGHECGNLYIINMYKLLKEFFEAKYIFRVGGDEFALILQNKDYDDAMPKLNAFKKKISELMNNSDLEPWERISVASGIAFYNSHNHEEALDVFKEADKIMYEEKKRMKACRE